MALSADSLFEQIKTNVLDKQYDDSETARNAMASTISDYVVSNAKLTGAYVGVIPGTPPVTSSLTPATGKLKALSTKLSLGTSAGAQAWLVTELASNLTWQCVADDDWGNAISTVTITSVTVEDLSSLTDPKEVWKKVCKAIINAVKTAVVTNGAVTDATDGSTGTITWTPIT